MSHESYKSLVLQALKNVPELFPWDLEEQLSDKQTPLLLDIREPDEFGRAYIKGSLNVPRGILEAACDWNYAETEPELVNARDREVIIICRSGNRSALAAQTMQFMGYTNVKSLKTGIRGWNDSEYELLNKQGNIIDGEDYDDDLNIPVSADKLEPK